MNNSRNKICTKNDFLEFFGFFSTKSQIHKSTKMRFPENQPKMVEFHKTGNSSEMVVRGWYMTHFDRRDLIHSKKTCLGWFRTQSDFPGAICEFSRFLREFHPNSNVPKNGFFQLSTPKICFKNKFSPKVLLIYETVILKLHFSIFTFFQTPSSSKMPIL